MNFIVISMIVLGVVGGLILLTGFITYCIYAHKEHKKELKEWNDLQDKIEQKRFERSLYKIDRKRQKASVWY